MTQGPIFSSNSTRWDAHPLLAVLPTHLWGQSTLPKLSRKCPEAAGRSIHWRKSHTLLTTHWRAPRCQIESARLPSGHSTSPMSGIPHDEYLQCCAHQNQCLHRDTSNRRMHTASFTPTWCTKAYSMSEMTMPWWMQGSSSTSNSKQKDIPVHPVELLEKMGPWVIEDQGECRGANETNIKEWDSNLLTCRGANKTKVKMRSSAVNNNLTKQS